MLFWLGWSFAERSGVGKIGYKQAGDPRHRRVERIRHECEVGSEFGHQWRRESGEGSGNSDQQQIGGRKGLVEVRTQQLLKFRGA